MKIPNLLCCWLAILSGCANRIPDGWGPTAEIESLRPISLCEHSRSASWIAVAGVRSATYPSRFVRMGSEQVEVTDLDLATDENIVGTLPSSGLIYNRVSAGGSSSAPVRLWDDNRVPTRALMFFRNVDGRPYVKKAIFVEQPGGVFVFSGPEVVARANIAATIRLYRENTAVPCPTAPYVSGVYAQMPRILEMASDGGGVWFWDGGR
jgi:hypothetical protein